MKTLKEFKMLVNEEILTRFEELELYADGIDPLFREMVTVMKEFIGSGGKRFRPYLAYIAYAGLGGTDENTIVTVASALELLHSFLLIHDDIIDQDYVRYGVKNVDGKYQERLASLPGTEPRRFGGSVAMLAGDVAHILSSQLIVNADIPADVKARLLSFIFSTTLKVAGGELVDTLVTTGLPDMAPSEERILRMYANKTASYTFELPLRTGALLAGHDADEDGVIARFSDAIGIAYQLHDDLIGIFGDSEQTGKPSDSDIREGKRTLLYCTARTMLPPDELSRFEELYGHQDASDDEVAEARSLLEKHGIRKAIEQQRDERARTAEELVPLLPFAAETKDALIAIIRSCTSRTA